MLAQRGGKAGLLVYTAPHIYTPASSGVNWFHCPRVVNHAYNSRGYLTMRGWTAGRSQRSSVYVGAAAAFVMLHGTLAGARHRCPAHTSHCAHEMLRSRKRNCLQSAPSFCHQTAAGLR